MIGFRDQMLQTFLAEARDLVNDLEDGLRCLKAGDRSPDLIGRLFRAAHSIKGSGGMFGLAPLVGFTHVVESLLDRVRAGTLDADAALIADLQDSCDHIADLLEALVAQGGELGERTLSRDAQLRDALARYDGAEGAGRTHAREATSQEPALAAASPPPAGDGSARSGDCWHISVRFGADVHRFGINPLSFVRELEELGEIVALTTLAEGMPDADEMDPESCYLGFEIALRSVADKQRIADVFDFVADCSELRILPPRGRIADFIELIGDMGGAGGRLGDILVQAGTLTMEELRACLALQKLQMENEGLQPPLGALLVEHQLVAPVVVQAALDRQAQARASANDAVAAPIAQAQSAGDSGFVRVRADQLDELINLVGELVIAGAGASMLAERAGETSLREAQSTVSRLMEDIRERTLRLRMVPIGETFARFHRVVREIGRDLGKQIELEIHGADTELDKSVVEKLADPLVHLVRNAADHGIESTEARLAAGKPAEGRIRLSAAHEGGNVVIEISDDGAGLNRDRIFAKAVERGLVHATAAMSDHDILQLIFEPGFSTAAAVTNLSGRGVGMDVVRRNIVGLRGSIEIDSPPGNGTTVRIRLPLTLAIIDGFLVGVGDAAFVLPLDRVVECVEMPEGFSTALGYLDLRGRALPLVRLREQLNVRGTNRTRRENVVVVDCGSHQSGFVVDALLGEFQTVIKPLGPLFAGLKGISGSTILGGGDVALIVDVPALAAMAAASETTLLSDRQPRMPVASAEPIAS